MRAPLRRDPAPSPPPARPGKAVSMAALFMFTAEPTDRALDGWCPREFLYTELEDLGLLDGVSCADEIGPALTLAATRGGE